MVLEDHKSKLTYEAFLHHATSKYTPSAFIDQQVWSWDHQQAVSGGSDMLQNDQPICQRLLPCGQQSVFHMHGVVCVPFLRKFFNSKAGLKSSMTVSSS